MRTLKKKKTVKFKLFQIVKKAYKKREKSVKKAFKNRSKSEN